MLGLCLCIFHLYIRLHSPPLITPLSHISDMSNEPVESLFSRIARPLVLVLLFLFAAPATQALLNRTADLLAPSSRVAALAQHVLGADHTAHAQVSRGFIPSGNPKFYLGISGAINIPMGEFGDKSQSVSFTDHPKGAVTGVQLRLINFGYFFNERYGLAVSALGGTNPVDITRQSYWNYRSLVAGPIISFPISGTSHWDIRPMIGYTVHTEDTIDEQSGAFSVNMGTSIRLEMSPRFSIMSGLDFLYSRAHFSTHDPEFSHHMGSLSVDLGIIYTFR